MGIKWNALMENERRQFEGMNEADKFVYFLLLQFGSPYGWGKENPERSDCSGAVCMALYAATGLLMRATADGLLKTVFTRVNPRQGDIRAVFYLDRKTRRASHVAGFVDEGVILNSQEPGARVRRITDVSDWFQKQGHDVLVRGLDRGALARLAADRNNTEGLDAEFSRYFGV